MIDSYNAKEPMAFRFIQRIIAARIALKGFIVVDYFPRLAEFYAEMAPWVADGTVKSRETVVEGLEKTPDAFLGLFKGENTGKMLIRL
jgi:NADPH-dependent curcumin reductase CurA